MDINEISPELKEKALACETTDELIELAKSVGVKLTDEQLEVVSGGGDWNCNKCKNNEGPCCGSTRSYAKKDGLAVSMM